MIFIIDDDEIMADCIKRACKKETQIFTNAIDAMSAISDGIIPQLIFLDILLTGPDGFTFLNELVSYSDTSQIPVVIISSLDFKNQDLKNYGVVGVLNKDNMLPQEISAYAEKYTQ